MPNTSKRMVIFPMSQANIKILFPFLRQKMQRWSILWFSEEEISFK